MRDLLDTIENVQRAVRVGNEPLSFGELTSAGHARAAAWNEAARLVREELNPQWKKVTAKFQKMLGINVNLDAGRLI